MALVNKVWCDVLALTCDAHVVPMEGIRQAISHHGVLHGGVSHLHARTHLYSVGSLIGGEGSEEKCCFRTGPEFSKALVLPLCSIGLTRLMLSIPPATTTVDSPVWMDWAPRHTAFSPEPQTI